MIERYLGKERAEDLFIASMLTGTMSDKEASEMKRELVKKADFWDFTKSVAGGIGGLAKEIPPALLNTMLLGAGTGALGATAYDVIKERVSHEDPEAKFNSEIEGIYRGRKAELDDAKWMERVRDMRDNLKRNYKKMTNDEYRKKYQELINALDEKMEA